MVNVSGKIAGMWRLLRLPFTIVFAVVIISLFGIYLFVQPRLAGDTASHMLLAVTPLLKLGSPYKDFWEIKPPVWPLIVYLWSNLFGFGLLSIKILNLLVAGMVMLLTYLIYRKVFPTPILEMFFAFTLLINFSPFLNTLILPTEIMGLMFSLSALTALLYAKKDFWKFYLSGLLFFFASQSKEPFTITVIAVFPVLLVSFLQGRIGKFVKNAIQFFLGMATGFATIAIYLQNLGSLSAYIQVFQFKELFYPLSSETIFRNLYPSFFRASISFIEFPGGILILVALALLIFLIVNTFKKILVYESNFHRLISKQIVIIDRKNIQKYVVLAYALGSFLGLGLGGKFDSHYLIQIVVPFYLICGLAVSFIYEELLFLRKKKGKYFIAGLFVFIFSLIITLPKRPYIRSYLPGSINFILEDRVYSFETRMKDLTNKNQCVLSVYGWGVSEDYLYSERRPCTRFFLANIVDEGWQKAEYRQSILDNPPALIVYRTTGADMDVGGFERNVVNFSKIIKNCYIQDTKEELIFVPKTSNPEVLKKCIGVNYK